MQMFPRETTSAVPFLTITGCERLHIEQHQGLIAYQEDEIVFHTAVGRLRVAGSKLMFSQYSAAEAVITGTLTEIAFLQGEARR